MINSLKDNYPNDKVVSNRAFISNLKSKYDISDSVRMPGVNNQTNGIKKLKLKTI